MESYVYGGAQFALNQTVVADINKKLITSTIRYIGVCCCLSSPTGPIREGEDTVYFGLALQTPIQSTFTGSVDVHVASGFHVGCEALRLRCGLGSLRGSIAGAATSAERARAAREVGAGDAQPDEARDDGAGGVAGS